MGVEQDHFAQFHSSTGAAGDMMSPRILPLPAIRADGLTQWGAFLLNSIASSDTAPPLELHGGEKGDAGTFVMILQSLL